MGRGGERTPEGLAQIGDHLPGSQVGNGAVQFIDGDAGPQSRGIPPLVAAGMTLDCNDGGRLGPAVTGLEIGPALISTCRVSTGQP